MDKKIIELGDALMALTTAEALELQNYLGSKGLKPAQPTIVAATVQAVEEVKESANVNIVLTKAGTILKLAKALRPHTTMPAMEIKKTMEVLPAVFFKDIPRETAKVMIGEIMAELTDEFIFELQDC